MLYKIIISIAATSAFFLMKYSKDVMAKIIIIGMVLSIGMSFIPLGELPWIYQWLFTLSLACCILYILLKSNLHINLKKWLSVSLIILIITHLFKLYHLPGAGILGFLCIIPLILLGWIFITQIRNTKNDVGIYIILLTDSFIQTAQSTEWLWNR